MITHMTFTVAEQLRAIVTAGVLAVEGAGAAEGLPALDAALAETAQMVRAAEGRPEVTAAVRAMYRRVGLDPTKTRPSSEALLRRLRKGDPLPRVNAAVDVCNWCSVETQVPFGLYDLGRLDGPIELRLGGAGETYAGIRKDTVHLRGRLVLADARGPFGNPTSDSARTMVTHESTRLLVVVYGPASLGTAMVERVVALTAERLERFTGGRRVAAFLA
jgi:DNA/RNA-binding domain of Phe-tRNA-synthetase-like protein